MPTIHGTNASETIDAADGVTNDDDVIFGYWGEDKIFGLGGDDVLFGGADADLLDGGADTDTASYQNSFYAVEVSLAEGKGYKGDATGDKLVNIENLTGSFRDDLLIGDNKDNTLNGNPGRDTLKGGGGADTLLGDTGNDLLFGGAGADTLNGGEGHDTVSYADSGVGVFVNLEGGGLAGDAQGDTYVSIEHVDGSQGQDILVGTAKGNSIFGLGGDDHIYAGDGYDTVSGGLGADVLWGGDGHDIASYAGSKAGVQINLASGTASGGDAQGDVLHEIEGLTGTDHADTLIGDGTHNSLRGGKGVDTIHGGDGNDTIAGGFGADNLDGGSGINTLEYWNSAAGVVINLGNGMAMGGDANGDTFTNFQNVVGSQTADSLFGNGLANRLDGGTGDDFLWGGLHNDVFVLRSSGSDTVLDFNLAEDKVEISDSVAEDFSALQGKLVQVGLDAHIVLSPDQELILENVNIASLQAGHFLFN